MPRSSKQTAVLETTESETVATHQKTQRGLFGRKPRSPITKRITKPSSVSTVSLPFFDSRFDFDFGNDYPSDEECDDDDSDDDQYQSFTVASPPPTTETRDPPLVKVAKTDASQLPSSRHRAINNHMLVILPKDTRQKKVVIHQFGSDPKETLVVEKSGMPTPKYPDHVVIKVQASTVTLRDCLFRRGHCFDLVNPTSLPLTPGHDVVGTIVSIGSKVRDALFYKEGDRVAALVRTGGNARFVSVPMDHLVRVPPTVDAAEAACMVSIYAAAYQSMKLVSTSSLKNSTLGLNGKKVLVIGGMDSVGQALVQMLNKARAQIYATCPKRRHGYMMNVLGAMPLSENISEWLPRVKGKMDVVFDGRCEDGLSAACTALTPKGKVVCFGYGAMINEPMGVFGAPMSAYLNKWKGHARAKNLDIWESLLNDPQQYKRNLNSLFQLLKENKLRPHIAKRVSLTDVAFSHSKLEAGAVRGNVVCMPWKKISKKNVIEANDEGRE